ncbi:hypothetical protein C2G38_2285190 [Gigaspora rosea]|uniref:Uncharacterized protein n=1 Tax=Gigaspora rosea TaxID=44941 RepID=A0A397VQL6_9GLOM|nr:hypothetical protein C2G38_2285190 [Gigaspora rosea]
MSWTLGSLQSFIILREMKNKKKQNKQNETSESKKVFIWCDSALKDIYYIDEKLTWADQKNDIITKLLPALCKKVNKKYNVLQQELLKMLYGRWRAHHCEFNIRKQGDKQVERNRRRKAKNSMVKDKKQRRVSAVDYLLAMKDPHIMKYPQSDLVAILKDSDIIQKIVELLRKKQPALKRLRITSQKYIQQTCFPPFGTPTWCLTNEALKKLNFPIENIPIYDSEKSNEGNDNNEDDDNNDSDDNSDTSKNTKKKNGKEKKSKKRSNKKKEKKKKSKKHRK